MLTWIIIILLVVFYIIGRNSSNNSQQNRQTRNNRPSQPPVIPYRRTGTSKPLRPSSVPLSVQIKKLYDPADHKVTSSPQQMQVISDVNTYQRARKKTVRPIQSSSGIEIISFDFSWSDDLQELIEATGVLYTNAQMNSTRRLDSERFHYYTNLHFRSFTAADLCHNKAQEIRRTCYDQVNLTLKRLNDRNDPLRVSKEDYNQIVRIKDSIKALVAFLEERRDGLNHQTGTLRDKIRDECGTGGRKWYDSLMERRSR